MSLIPNKIFPQIVQLLYRRSHPIYLLWTLLCLVNAISLTGKVQLKPEFLVNPRIVSCIPDFVHYLRDRMDTHESDIRARQACFSDPREVKSNP